MAAQKKPAPAHAQQFQIQQLYIKRQGFEALNLLSAFIEENANPKINYEIKTTPKPLTDNLYEVTLTINIEAAIGEQKAFTCYVAQAGAFLCEGFTEEEQKFLLGGSAADILFPYARKVITDLVLGGGFPPLVLAPINFEGMYMQEQQKQQGAVSRNKAPATARKTVNAHKVH